MPGVVAQDSAQHHHRSTTKTSHKPYKPRFASKNAIRDKNRGRVESLEKGQRRTPHQHVMSKFDRKNQSKQRRMARQSDHDRARSIFAGKDGAARVVAVLPLCKDIDPRAAIEKLNGSLDIDTTTSGREGFVTIDRFKQKLQYIPLNRDLNTALDACRVADYVVCVLSAEEEVDGYGELILRSIENQGISNVYTVAAHLDKLDQPKRRTQTLTSLKSFITHFFAEQEKIFALDSRQECQNVVRSLCTTTPKGIHWRQNRSWMYVEEVKTSSGKAAADTDAEVVLTGVVRGRNLKADRLIRLNNLGDFQISLVTAAPRPQPAKAGKDAMTVDSASPETETLDTPSADADTLDTLAPEETVMQDAADDARSLALTERKSVLLDDEVLDAPEDEDEEPAPRKRLPKGTSDYQAAWYLGDEDQYDSDFESDDDAQAESDVEMDTAPDLIDAGAGPSTLDPTDAATTVADNDAEEAGDLANFRRAKDASTSADSDRQFPDEIELPPSVLARDRLAKYRGLKSARTSPWATDADKPHEPASWPRLLDVAHPAAAKNRVFNEALVGGVPAGRRVAVHLRVPAHALSHIERAHEAARAGGAPLALTSLLRHEHKASAMHATLTIPRDFPRPLRSKEQLVVQAGARRFRVTAVLSQPGATPNDVHRLLRWAWPGDTVVVSWVGPVTWGAVPVVYFAPAQAPDAAESAMATDEPAAGLTLLGAGTLLAPSTSRVLAKRAVLTGEPYALHKRQTHVRYMFFNAADVRYFSALPLWTTRGRRGTVKESLGTHGQFKAVFDGRVNPLEAVGVSLWKRVWPRPAVEIGGVESEDVV